MDNNFQQLHNDIISYISFGNPKEAIRLYKENKELYQHNLPQQREFIGKLEEKLNIVMVQAIDFKSMKASVDLAIELRISMCENIIKINRGTDDFKRVPDLTNYKPEK